METFGLKNALSPFDSHNIPLTGWWGKLRWIWMDSSGFGSIWGIASSLVKPCQTHILALHYLFNASRLAHFWQDQADAWGPGLFGYWFPVQKLPWTMNCSMTSEFSQKVPFGSIDGSIFSPILLPKIRSCLQSNLWS